MMLLLLQFNPGFEEFQHLINLDDNNQLFKL